MSRRQAKRERMRRKFYLLHSAGYGRRLPHTDRMVREVRREARWRILEVLRDFGPDTLTNVVIVLDEIANKYLVKATAIAGVTIRHPISGTYTDEG